MWTYPSRFDADQGGVTLRGRHLRHAVLAALDASRGDCDLAAIADQLRD